MFVYSGKRWIETCFIKLRSRRWKSNES